MGNRFEALNAKITKQHDTFVNTPVHDISNILGESTKANNIFLEFNNEEHGVRIGQVTTVSYQNQQLKNEMNKLKMELAVEKCVNANAHHSSKDLDYKVTDCALTCVSYNEVLPAGVDPVDCNALVAFHKIL